MINSFLHWAAVLAGWAFGFGDRRKAKKWAKGRAVPEITPEAPAIPQTALKALAERERIAQSYDMGAKRRAWARDMDLEAEINEMIGTVREGDAR